MLREPLLHFVVLGAAVFLVHRWVAPAGAEHEVVVSASAREGMRQEFKRRTGREPSATDEAALVDGYVDEEVAVREALALGLERGDPVVRRRLVQKMGLLLESTETLPDPSDAELDAFLKAHADRYATPARVSLEQVFVSTDRHPADAAARAASVRQMLVDGADPSGLGDPYPRGAEFRLHAQAELATIFGSGFAAELMKLPPATWSQPLRSTAGWHIVRVTEQRAGTSAALGQIRERVAADWRAVRRDDLEREARERLRRRYVVRIERGTP